MKGPQNSIIIAIALMASGAALADRLPGPVVGAAWLAAHRGEVVVLDVREDPAEFDGVPTFAADQGTGRRRLVGAAGHIQGALMMEYSRLRTERTIDGIRLPWLVPSAGAFQELMRQSGVPAGRPIVIVTQAASPEDLDVAARAYWTIKYYGGSELAILDGGTIGWLEEGYPVVSSSDGKGAAARGDWSAGPPVPGLLADSLRVAKALESGVQLVDARPPAYFFGLQVKASVGGAGHIQGAINFPAELLSRPAGMSQHFLSATQYRSIFTALGISPERPLIAYCNTGHLAAGAWFVASEILNNPDAALYDGSLARWSAEGRPLVETR